MDKIGLYIHWPYCARICPYCNFNIYKNRPDIEDALIDAILADMQHWRELSGSRRLASIHFGGGTPSLLKPINIQRIIDLAVSLWTTEALLEIGLEANPNDITKVNLREWKHTGIERLSIGSQSFDEGALKFLGRDHDSTQASKSISQALAIMPRVSADFIYGWAGQDYEWPYGLGDDLSDLVNTGVTHISAYQLTIEAKTAFAKAEMRGIKKVVSENQSADFFEDTIWSLQGDGFTQYEVSNFAKGNDAKSRHNLLYWQGGDYVGIGPGAHGRLTVDGKRTATIAALKPNDYIDAVRETGHGIAEQEVLSPQSWAEEYVLMGMRITEGISLSRYKQISGQDLSPEIIAHYEKTGLLKHEGDQLSATPKGRLVLDTLCHELLS